MTGYDIRQDNMCITAMEKSIKYSKSFFHLIKCTDDVIMFIKAGSMH